MALSIEVVSPAGRVWEGEASRVRVPLIDGEMGILPGRQSLLALLGSGRLRVEALGDGSVDIEVKGGFCSVDQDVITIAADEAHRRDAGDIAGDRAGDAAQEGDREDRA